MIEFHELARDELRQAVMWYRARSLRSAQRFVQELRRVVDRVQLDPPSYPSIASRFRYVRIRRFPFILVYEVRRERDVFVIAVAHTSRRTGYWRRR